MKYFRSIRSNILALTAGLVCFSLLGLARPVLAQAQYSGNYSGQLYVQFSGAINQPETAVGPIILSIDSTGAIRNGINVTSGAVVGNVSTNGLVTFTPPLGNITNAVILTNSIAGTNSTTAAGLITRYRVHAPWVSALITPPVITNQPAGLAVAFGTPATLAVGASGQSLAYQWFVGARGVTTQPLPGATNSSVTTPPITGTTQFWVRISNPGGTADSLSATVSPIGTPAPPVIVLQPHSHTVTAGATVSLSVSAQGTPTLQYQWQKDGTNISGAISSNLVFSPAALTNTGVYRVVITNAYGTVTSSNAILNVRPVGAPEFTRELSETTLAAVGTNLRLEVTVTGLPPFGYQWYFRSLNNLIPIAGATNTFLQIGGIQPSQAGEYAVIITNRLAAATNRSTVRVIQPPRIGSDSDAEIRLSAGQQLSLGPRSFIGNNGPYEFQWFKDAQAIAGATNQNYVKIASVADSGNYQVRVSNMAGSTNSIVTKVAVFAEAVPAWISRQIEPASITVEEGGSIFLSLIADGMRPLHFAWYRDNQLLQAGASLTSYATNNVTLSASGAYYAIVTNSAGKATSAVARVTVFPRQTAPALTPAQYTTNKNSGESVTLRFAVQGDFLSHQWSRQLLTNNQTVEVNLPGATNATLTLNALKLTDAGAYFLTVTNFKGSARAQAQLNVITAPQFIQHPQSQDGLAGISVTLFGVVEPQFPILHYQWFKDSVGIARATNSSYNFTLSATNAGSYTLRATNSAGVALSTPAAVRLVQATAYARPLTLIADRTIPIPDREGATFRSQGDGSLRGRIVTFQGGTNAPDVAGFYRWDNGLVGRIYAPPTALPGLSAGAVSLHSSGGEESGVFPFIAIGTNNSEIGFYEWNRGAIRMVLDEATSVPGKPGVTFSSLGHPRQSGGKTAVLGATTSAAGSYRALLVWNGTSLAKWVDSEAPLPAGTGLWHGNSAQVGFDGNTAAFWAFDSNNEAGIFATTNGAPLRKIAFMGDPIPGRNDQIRGLRSPPLVQNGRILFLAEGNAQAMYLLESANNTLSVIVKTGDVAAGSVGGFTSLSHGFDYAADETIMFTAEGPGQKSGVYRYRNGAITPELTSLNLLEDRIPRLITLQDAEGAELLLNVSFNGTDFGLYSTLRIDTTIRPRISFSRAAGNLTLTWSGGGTLEASSDLRNWQTHLGISPATIPFGTDRTPRFFRVKIP